MKLIADYLAEEFTSAVAPYVPLKEVAHGMVCLSESHQGVNFRDVICARRYLFVIALMKFCS